MVQQASPLADKLAVKLLTPDMSRQVKSWGFIMYAMCFISNVFHQGGLSLTTPLLPPSSPFPSLQQGTSQKILPTELVKKQV